MVYGNAAVTPSGNEITEQENATTKSLPRSMAPGGTALTSRQSDPSVLLKQPKPQKPRRYNSMFSLFTSDRPTTPPRSENNVATPSKTSTRIVSSGRLKWDWKLGDLWHRRTSKPETLIHAELNPFISNNSSQDDDSIADDNDLDIEQQLQAESPSPPPEVTRNGSQPSLHYTSLGIFESAKFSSSDLEPSGSAKSSDSHVDVDEVQSSREPLATRWREIQGENNWESLLDPLDIDLRRELLRYGDMAQMAYDNFEDQLWSKYAGSAKYSKQNMFEKLGGEASSGYQVTRYLYATCENPLPGVLQSSISSEKWDVESNWMGFVAVATDEWEIARLGRRDIVVSWRGTMRTMEWLVDAQIQMAPMTRVPEKEGTQGSSVAVRPKVEKGFWSLYTCKRSASQFNQKSASEQVMRELSRLLTLYKGEPLSITLTGHSLGGALALLTAYEIAETGLNKTAITATTTTTTTIPVTVFSFGSPRVGDAVFKRRFDHTLNLRALRVVNVRDIVPKAIGGFFTPWSDSYHHVGVELALDCRLSPYLKPSRDPIAWHSLECYLHHVDGRNGGGKGGEFGLVTGRDVALVNKYGDVLRAEYCVPGWWWQCENKGLQRDERGRWVEPARRLEDMPSLENRDRFI